MDPQDKHPSAARGCDESKCVSRGMSNVYNDSFTCYGDDGPFYPMMCADGFLPVVAENEPSRAIPTGVDGSGDATVRYFTCCPPYNDISSESLTTADDVSIVRHCTDPITVPNDTGFEGTDTICNNSGGRKHPRQMKSYREQNYNSFVCCDSAMTAENYYFDDDDDDLSNSTIASKFLDDAECVPYRNEFYDAAKVKNEIGKICPVVCDFVEGDFLFPRPIDNATNADVAFAGHYQCCKNGPALPPYIQDSAFWISLYPIVALWCITAVVSAILVIGLSAPLVIQLKNGTFRKEVRRRSSSSSIRRKPSYSTYNLYVVCLAFLDLSWALCAIGLYSRIINQNYNPNFYGVVVSPSCSSDRGHLEIIPELVLTVSPYTIGNVWINAIISYEVLLLLKKSKVAKRISQPDLKRVCLQVGAVYFLTAISIPVFLFALEDKPEIYTTSIGFLLSPILYILYAPIWTCWRGYIPSLNGATLIDKAMRELAFYFFRIVAVFVCIWFPTLYVNTIALDGQYWAWLLFMCLFAIQPLATACCILTKSDSRKYILDLVTLSYLKENKSTMTTRSSMYQNGRASASASHTGNAFGSGASATAHASHSGNVWGSVASATAHASATGNAWGSGASAFSADVDDVAGVSDDGDEDALIFSVLGFTLADANPDGDPDGDPDADADAHADARADVHANDTELNDKPNTESHENSVEIVFYAESDDDDVPR